MRLWSLHPCYLDPKGLVALWRESLLAKKVLEGNTKGYKNHPQLLRFKKSREPLRSINAYLQIIHEESLKRGYHFDKSKVESGICQEALPVNRGQLLYEFNHLLKKLSFRAPKDHEKLKGVKEPDCHPLFYIVPGEVEPWEIRN